MAWLIALYSLIVLISLTTFLYSLWSYHECPATRSHKPYVFPIFVSLGWFIYSIDSIARPTKVDGYALLVLIFFTLLALLIYVHHYRNDRRTGNEIVREKNSVQ